MNREPSTKDYPRLPAVQQGSHQVNPISGNTVSAPGRPQLDAATKAMEEEFLKQFDSPIEELIKERGKVYGDPEESHTNIGLSWTALLQQHYGMHLPEPIPASLVAQMMVVFKMQRAARVFHADNYDDAAAYLKFAKEFQCPLKKPGDEP